MSALTSKKLNPVEEDYDQKHRSRWSRCNEVPSDAELAESRG